MCFAKFVRSTCNSISSDSRNIFIFLLCFVRLLAARRVQGRDPEARSGDFGDEREDENTRGTTSGLPTTHRSAQGVFVC